MRPAFLALCVTLLLSAVAGCLGGAETPSLVLPDTIQAVYHAPSGEELHVETEGFGLVRNATGATVPSFRMYFGFGGGPKELPLIPLMTEHIDQTTGMIIRHDRHCVPRSPSADSPCFEGRARISFDAAGLPGGLGMAPLWFAEPSFYERNTLVADTVHAEDRTYHVQLQPEAGCKELTISADPAAPYLRTWTEPTVLEGPWRMCEPFLLPKSFRPTHALSESLTPSTNITFELVSYTEGPGLLQQAELTEPSGDCRQKWMDEAKEVAPLSGHDLSSFTSLEAHAKARELDSTYRNLSESDPWNVAEAVGAGGGGFRSNFPDIVPNTTNYHWILTVVSDDHARRVDVSKRFTDATLTSPAMTSYEIKSAEDVDLAEAGVPFGRGNLTLTIGSVAQMVDQLEHVELLNIEMGHSTRADWLPEGAPRDQDYAASYFFRKIPDGEGAAPSGGSGFVVPLWISMDSTRPAVTAITIMAEDRDLVETMDWCPS